MRYIYRLVHISAFNDLTLFPLVLRGKAADEGGRPRFLDGDETGDTDGDKDSERSAIFVVSLCD